MTDHHDNNGNAQNCNDPHVVLVRGGNERSIRPTNLDIDGTSQAWRTLSAAEAKTSYDAGNAAGQVASGCTVSADKDAPETCVNRAELGQYLVTYTASDLSGNQAEPVAFSFLFIDPFVPTLDFGSGNDNGIGQNNRMYGYPNVDSGYPTFTGKGKAIFPGDSNFGCGSQCVADTLNTGTGKTWGALYSAVGSEATNKNVVDDLWETDFQSDPTVVGGRTLTTATSGGIPTEMSASAITELNLDSTTYGTHTVVTKANQNFEAGWIKSRRYGGFYDEAENKEQNPDLDVGFCARDGTDNTAVCAGLGQTACATAGNGCAYHAVASRASAAHWSYPVTATATDNYRCVGVTAGTCSALQVYYQLTQGSTVKQWELADGTVAANIVMEPGLKVRISWFVDDSAGDFGFKQMSNPQTHTIQFYVTDKTRPIITPAQKATYVTASATTDFQTNAAGFALNPTLLDDAELAALGYASVKCSQINDAKLCTGTCTWDAASGCAGAATDTVLQSCVSKVSSATADDTQCWSKTTASDCWTVKNKCFWTTSQTFVDNGDYVTSEADVTTCESPLVEYSYYVPDCTLTNDAAKKHNAKCNAGSIQWTAANTMKYTEHKKCRPANNVVDRSSLATASKNAYTIVVECGYKEGGSPYTTAVSDTDANVKSGYQEFGARAFDNWDNVHVVSGSTTTYKNIDLFTDGTSSSCAAADNAWVSCERSASTPGKPSTGDYNTLSYNTKSMGKGGYGAVYNGQLVRETASTASRWPQRGLYYRSGLLNCATCDAKDFKNDFLVVYRYTDQSDNSARPLMRKVVTRDTTPPTVQLIGDQTLENSAGSYVHSTASSNDAQCVQKTNRSAACNTDHATEQLCNADAACIWSYEDADNYAADQDGLFDQDRIITYFKHRDDCDKDIVTTVAMYSGLCPTGASDTRTKITCDAASSSDTSACYAGFFQYRSAAADASGFSDAFEQPDSDDNLMADDDTRMQKFPEWTAGDYSITYEAMDSAGLKHSVCRNIYNVDHTFPIIQILGSDQMTLEATHQGNYIDDGATCSDQVDGVISQNVEVSGDVVNLSKVGTYTITYNCKDSANNAAPAARRTVVVAQTSCPRCHVFGEDEINHEASFPYADAGAACSDVIDGTTTTKCYTTNAASADTAVSCEGSTLVDVETTGTYTIQYRSTNTVGLWNDGTNCRGGPISYYRTVVVMDTLRPVISLKYDNGDTNSLVARGTKGNNDGNAVGGGQGANGEVTNDIHDTSTGAYPSGTMDSLYDAELNGQFVDPGTHLPTLMAEESTSSVNGWVVGAIASAVAGLALLGYSTRRTAVATSVPV